MLLALLTFSISVIWFLTGFLKVESTHHFDVAEQTAAGVLAVTSVFLASFTFLSNASFQTQSSGDLGSVVMNIGGEASCSQS